MIFCLLASILKTQGIQITLKAKSTDGFKLDQAAVGQPFVVEVVVEGSSSSKRPEIKGIERFRTSQTGVSVQIINGQASVTHSFHVIASKPGEYIIGPAIIEDKGNTYESNKLDVSVSDQQLLDPEDELKRSENQKVIFELIPDKEDVFVGEKINCRFRFYYLKGDNIKLEGVVPSESKEFRRKKNEKPIGGTVKINDQVYNYLESRWIMYPKRAGIITLPAYQAIYKVPAEDSFFGGFSSFFGRSYEQKEIFSNPLTFNVQSLPPYDGVVTDVGQFNSFYASVDRAVAKQGDGIVYTLEIEGDNDFDTLDLKEVKNMPEKLKYYDSKRYVLDNSAKMGMKKKRFEFIVQAMEPGIWTIPVQEFTYFDPEEKKYKTLKTEPVTLKILKGVAKPFVPLDQPQGKQGDRGKDKVPEAHDEIRDIQKHRRWYGVSHKAIPLWVFILVMLFPLLPFGITLGKNMSRKVSERYSPHMIKKYAFSKAIKSLRFASKKNDFRAICSIFITLFAERFGLNEILITQDDIIKILQEKEFSQQEINNWENFVAKISSFAYYGTDKVRFDKNMFEQAIFWLDKFKEKF